jgi:aminoglycoside phosphotransferase (APT) family kinase protein
MDLFIGEREPGETSGALSANQIIAMCRRAFGEHVHVASARELRGGTFNTTYLIALADRQVVLRIAPPPAADQSWDEVDLMRRELHLQPFFAALGPLMPRTIVADFTRQIVDRDYVFQTFLAGERWDEVAGTLAADEANTLWDQFGRVTKTIHATAGAAFGGPHPLPEFPTWSQAVVYRLERALDAMAATRLDLADMTAVLDIVRRNPAPLDAIRRPRLLHGDLWLFNILIERGAGDPRISGVLDADRAWWGDPLADWTMFVLAKSASPETQPLHDRFWDAYGRPEATPAGAFRAAVYEALNIGLALPWAARHDDEDTVRMGQRDLRAAAASLAPLRA